MKPLRALFAIAVIAASVGCSLVSTWDGLTGDGGVDARSTTIPPADAAMPEASAGDGCATGEQRCGGHRLAGDPDVLYRCEMDGGATLVERCTYGCLVDGGPLDSCRVCFAGGLYCGGDKISGDPKTLYRCNVDGTTSVNQICPNACVQRAGQNDVCN